MLKKIKVQDLRKGMFIVKMDRAWIDHPFLTNKKKITSESQINKLIEYGIKEVYIDPTKGVDVTDKPPISSRTPVAKPDIAETAVKIEQSTAPEPSSLISSDLPEVPFEVEIKKARVIQREALTVVKDLMQDVRVGKNIEGKRAAVVVNAMIDSIFRNQDALFGLSRIKDYDTYTFVHSINVCVLSLAIGRRLNFNRPELQELGVGALLHDVGKMKIPSAILNKPTKLTPEEFIEIKKHPFYSVGILERSGGIPEKAKEIALQHHERQDGSGYPFGLQGEQISRESQLVAIIDVYDAITSVRCYSRGMPAHEGVKKIFEWSKKDFNQELVERFVQAVGIYPVGTLVQLDTGEVGLVQTVNPAKLLRPRVFILYQDSRWCLHDPQEVDLMEKSESQQRYKRTIVKPLDPTKWNLDVNQFLPGLS
jgi:HD-GYP domain-containing protein (c-di-GMP phosphodiesterase class II)